MTILMQDPSDAIAASPPAQWARGLLEDSLAQKGSRPDVRLCGFQSEAALAAFDESRLSVPDAPEALALLPLRDGTLVAAGRDPRGLVYATLELADRVNTESPWPDAPVVQQPANPIRGVARLFVSDVEDLPWFHDRQFWSEYLSHLAAQRFNRIHLAFGIGHDFLRNVIDAYFLFAYPFLVDVPGYEIRARGLSDADRARNLDTLRFASDEAARRGLHFQLGIWTQAYEWVDSPNANYVIDGLTPENHAAYCRDAVRAVLQACPSIAGVTFRVHGESGVPEGNYDFWREVFSGVATCGRPLELDLHPKGVGPAMIAVAQETGLLVTLSPKFTAEHMGLPGHQVAIRELERVGDPEHQADPFVAQLMNRSGADLRYTRYGNADFLRENRGYGLFYRMWPGTQRLLLWGDPKLAAGYGRAASFCGSLGLEFCEPLSFKGRRGSGLPGGREGYAAEALRQDGGADWQKYRYTYRVLGRLLYDPEEEPAVWQRALAHEYGAESAASIESALAHASRILPLVTSAYHPSAANNRYWPEIYTTLPIVDAERSHPYRDTPSPRRFGTASPLDPGLFSGVDEFVREITAATPSGRISPLRVAATLTSLSQTALSKLAHAEAAQVNRGAPAFQRLAVDVSIQAALGQFFAAKLRAGVAYALWQTSNQSGWLRQAVDEYTAARAAWCRAAEHGRVYRDDITVGGEPWLRGHWADRLPAIDADLADMRAELDSVSDTDVPSLDSLEAPTPQFDVHHEPPAAFVPGAPLHVELGLRGSVAQVQVTLHYRHVNHAETYECMLMREVEFGQFAADIPAAYTHSAFPLQYFVVVQQGKHALRAPDLDAEFANQPYWLVRQRTGS